MQKMIGPRKQFIEHSALVLLLVMFVFSVWTSPLAAQSTVSGDIAGTVTDPSGAVVPNATVTLHNNQTAQTQTRTTNATGFYRFPLLAPGNYTVTVSAPNLGGVSRTVPVTVGQATTVNLQMTLQAAQQTVEVTAQPAVIQTENGNVSTTFNADQIALTPNPGNDLTNIPQTAPGAVMNTQAGYGNFSTYGLPGTSNLFTYNGQNENDPYLNLNNSGATNLLLGQNDVGEATVVNNGYTGQYGGLAGANVNYVSKQGSDQFHGNAVWWWNGRVMNANDFFNKRNGLPRPFDNVNQWAASIGGPIRKGKTFFFIDTEGMRVVLPVVEAGGNLINVPSPQFQAATLANIAATSPAQLPFYQRMFNIYNSAPGAGAAANTLPGGGCAAGFALPGGAPCALQFLANPSNSSREWLLTARVDQNIGANDRLFGHFRTDHGFQATYTDPLTPAFNGGSVQPQYEGQLNETHTFGNNAVNQFIAAGSWYSAIFTPDNAAAAAALMPYEMTFAGSSFYTLGGINASLPQGRNVTQYQVVDDYSHVIGSHSLKFGVNFKRNDITDYSPSTTSIFPFVSGETMASFFAGTGDVYVQAFPQRLTQPIALYQLGFYGQDEWKISNRLTITLTLRADHNSNPVCQTNCFARLSDNFLNLTHDPAIPYNQVIQTGLHQAIPSYTKIDWQPRFGFAWQPYGNGNTVLRGGFGLFTDAFPAATAAGLMNNAPLNNTFVSTGGLLASGLPGSNQAIAAAANASFLSAFNAGGTLASITASNPFFVPPSFYNSARRIHYPRYQEWNLQLQQALGQKMSATINYSGNHGIWEPVQNGGLNAFCDATCTTTLGTPFIGLPTAPLDPRFGGVYEVESSAVSNYNGVTVSLQRKFSAVQLQANYSWSHAIDEISNGGFLPFNFLSNFSILNPIDPFNLRRNYGNADYDTRHYASLNWVFNMPQWRGPKSLVGGWVLSGTLFTRSGLPFSIVDSNAASVLAGFNYNPATSQQFIGGQLLATPTGGPIATGCDRSAVDLPCLSTTSFGPATSFAVGRRNGVFGPSFFNMDVSLMKNFALPHWESGRLGVGITAFNVLNHVNFDQPNGDIANPQFGLITSDISVPTSVFGSFLGGNASPRILQVNARLTF